MGQGIAGTVAATGETIIIADAYADPRFSNSADKASNYRTNTIICMPIISTDGAIAGVLQAINKKEGFFSAVDEEVLKMLSLQSGNPNVSQFNSKL
jgi:GAF domain-containing protein